MADLDGSKDELGLVGETVAGRFLVERAVAEGGFGVVYEARHLALERSVALKVLKTPLDTPASEVAASFEHSFEAEARAIARLQHPNIVAVYDFGVSRRASGEPLHWIALEWLEGRTLETVLEERRAQGRGPLDPPAALALLRPVIEAIAFAHERGIAHRDLKPANIFVQHQAGRQLLKVLDFGIARMLAPDEQNVAGGAAAHTTHAFRAFSPEYAAPEQVTEGRTGPWTDVHALGLLLTECLTGQRPYGRASNADDDGRLEAIVASVRPTPGSKGVGVGPWEAVLAKALARRPGDRFAHAGALLAALDADVPAAGERRRSIASASMKPRRRWVVAAAALALGMLAAGVVGWRAWRRPAPDRVMMAVLPFQNLTGDPAQEYLTDGLTEGMISRLSRIQPRRLGVIARTSVNQYKNSRKTIREIGNELAVSHILECTVNRAGDNLQVQARLVDVATQSPVWSESYERGLGDVVTLQSEIAQAIARGVHLQLTPAESAQLSRARAVSPAAYEAYLRGLYFWDRFILAAKAGPYFEQATILDDGFAEAFAALANYYLTGNGGALNRCPKGRPAAERAYQLNEQLPDAQLALGEVVYYCDWNWQQAERHFRRAIDLDPNTVEAYNQLGKLLEGSGLQEQSIAAKKKALALAPFSVRQNLMLGGGYFQARRYQEAIVQLERSLELEPGADIAKLFIGFCHGFLGRHREALEWARQGPDSGRTLAFLVQAHVWLGDIPQALAALDKLKSLPKVDEVNMAKAYTALGHREEAFAWLEKAYSARHPELFFFRTDPLWDPIRKDPRYDDLLRRIGGLSPRS